jgi:hypothetical protein
VKRPAATTRARVAHAAPGRLRVRIDAPRGQGKLGRLAEELNRMPDTHTVRTNHAARSVTVTYDPHEVSGSELLERLCDIGLLALDLANPDELSEALLEKVVPLAEDPTSVPGRFNVKLLQASLGAVDLFRVTVAILVVSAGLSIRGALLRGQPIPWMRILTYLLAATSIWTRHQERGHLALIGDTHA